MASAKPRRSFFAAALACVASVAGAQHERDSDGTLQRLDDRRVLSAQMVRERTPLLILFSTPGCPYCREVRRNYLQPRLRERPATVLIREVDVTSVRRLIDRNGRSVSEAEFAQRHSVKVVPHVLLFNASGTALTEPLIGIDSAGFYEARLVGRIDEARRALAR
jgi:thioredoxin-related protein